MVGDIGQTDVGVVGRVRGRAEVLLQAGGEDHGHAGHRRGRSNSGPEKQQTISFAFSNFHASFSS